MLAYAYHSGKQSAYANAGMLERAQEHADRARRARFGTRTTTRTSSPQRKRSAPSQEPTPDANNAESKSWMSWFAGTMGYSGTREAESHEGRSEPDTTVAPRGPTLICAWENCMETAVYAFAPCDHALLCESHFRRLGQQRLPAAMSSSDGKCQLADILPPCADLRRVVRGSAQPCATDATDGRFDIARAECCTVRRNPLVARNGSLYETTIPDHIMTRLQPQHGRCGPCVNQLRVCNHDKLKLCDRPVRPKCEPLTSEELGKFYNAICDTWKYGAWVTPNQAQWGSGRFGPGS
jgi:hypothetical protein